VLWEEGFGWADRANRIPATPHTLYSLASISKPITSTGLMILQERGLLDLDRPIDDYLGDAKLTARVGSAADATVRRVANHTAGLPLHYQFFYADQPHRPPPTRGLS
jgi:CubicO group peptidase (beta-lactamase class C family)